MSPRSELALQVGWLNTLEPTWNVAPLSGSVERVLLESRRSETERHYDDPDGLYFCSRSEVHHRMETILLPAAKAYELKGSGHLQQSTHGPTGIRVKLREAREGAEEIPAGALTERKLAIEGEKTVDISIVGSTTRWHTQWFESSIRNPLVPGGVQEHIYVSISGIDVDLPADDLLFRWAPIVDYVRGRRKLLG